MDNDNYFKADDYDFPTDIKNEVFEKIFAVSTGKEYELSHGWFPYWDVKIDNKTYEIKRDYWYEKTGNLLVEEFKDLEKKIEGWAYHTTADFYVVVFNPYEYYIVNMYQVLNDFFNKISNWSILDIKQKRDKYGNPLPVDKQFITRNWLTPLDIDVFNPVFKKLDNNKKQKIVEIEEKIDGWY